MKTNPPKQDKEEIALAFVNGQYSRVIDFLQESPTIMRSIGRAAEILKFIQEFYGMPTGDRFVSFVMEYSDFPVE